MPSSIIGQADRDKLYTQVYHLLGMPVRSVELTEEQMDTFLELSISEYEQYVSDWLIESQWSSLIGIDLDEQSLSRAFTTRSMDYETQFTYSYSKIVGLQAGGPWELKKDYIDLIKGQQTYSIPPGRELNEILWFSRPELTDTLVNPFLGGLGGLGGTDGGFAQPGGGGSYHMMPAFDILLRMQDRSLKNRLIGAGDLTYRITAGPLGTKIIHLYNVPGGRHDFYNSANNYRVWYWYYETNGDRDECLEQNKDIVRLPSDVPIETLTWEKLNKPAQNWVRKYLIAYSKEGLSRIWGKFSGDLQVPDSTIKLDYATLQTEAKDDKLKLNEELLQRLERLRPDKILERKANEAENLNKSLKFRPFNSPYTVI
jgi:hypothetical protein